MNDQSQNSQNPTLSLEEELDVLEAVYKVGKEKGLDLLRPEQIKKLMESGRIKDNGIVAKKGIKTRTSSTKVGLIVDGIMYGLLESCKREVLEVAGDTNYQPTEADLSGIVWDKFVFEYGADPTNFREFLINNYLRVGNNGS